MASNNSSIRMTLELLQDCLREATNVHTDEGLEEQVMALFRAEDMKGIAELMNERKLEREFMNEMTQFISRWTQNVEHAYDHDDR